MPLTVARSLSSPRVNFALEGLLESLGLFLQSARCLAYEHADVSPNFADFTKRPELERVKLNVPERAPFIKNFQLNNFAWKPVFEHGNVGPPPADLTPQSGATSNSEAIRNVSVQGFELDTAREPFVEA